jgi:hypothetical protein
MVGAVGMGFTVIVKSTGFAHSLASGVKVYVVVFVLSNAGAHVPLIPLREVVGNAAKGCPLQIGATAAKEGVLGVGAL